jgi:hypothetical protein
MSTTDSNTESALPSSNVYCGRCGGAGALDTVGMPVRWEALCLVCAYEIGGGD